MWWLPPSTTRSKLWLESRWPIIRYLPDRVGALLIAYLADIRFFIELADTALGLVQLQPNYSWKATGQSTGNIASLITPLDRLYVIRSRKPQVERPIFAATIYDLLHLWHL